jgi:hypothetical protein
MLAWGNFCAHSNKVSVRDLAIVYPEAYDYLVATWISDVKYECHATISLPVPRKRWTYTQARVRSIGREIDYNSVTTTLHYPSTGYRRIGEWKVHDGTTSSI